MKLSKKNAARQSAIHKAIVSGKALGGLLVGLAATSAIIGCENKTHASGGTAVVQGDEKKANAENELALFDDVTMGEIAVDGADDENAVVSSLQTDMANMVNENMPFTPVGCIAAEQDNQPKLPPTTPPLPEKLRKGNLKEDFGGVDYKADDVKVETDL